MSRHLERGLALIALSALACAACAPVRAATVEGTAIYRERIALPADAVFEAVLLDISRADAPAPEVGRAKSDPAGQPPFRFTIPYDPAAVQAGRRYAVRATVTHQGRVLFTTDRVYPVFEGQAAPLRLLLVSASAERPADSPLRGTYWRLVRLGDTPVQVVERPREPHLILASSEARVSGSGGCNRVTGSFALDGDRLRLRQMAATKMACATGMDQEQRFLRLLETVERYRISGNHLDFLDVMGATIARFEAVAVR